MLFGALSVTSIGLRSYFIDAQGRIRHHRSGEGEYEQSELMIQELLAESGVESVGHGRVSAGASGLEAAADQHELKSGETYAGYERTENFASLGGAALDQARAIPFRLGQASTTGPHLVIGLSGKRQSCQTSPAGGLRIAFTREISISLWRRPAKAPHASGYSWVSRQRPPGEATSSTAQMARSRSRALTSSSGKRSRSLKACGAS